MKQGQKLLKNQSGQAVVEYILILVITIGLVMFAKNLFQGARNFTFGYVGDYFKCLISHGELPDLGVRNSDLKKHTSGGYSCSFEGFKSGSSKSSAGGSSSQPNLRSSGDKTEANKGSTDATARQRSGSTRDENNSNVASQEGQGGPSVRTARNPRRSGSSPNTADAVGAADDKTQYLSSLDGSGRRRGDGLRTERTQNLAGAVGVRTEKTRKIGMETGQMTPLAQALVREEENARGPRRTKFNPPERTVAATDQQADLDSGFSFGNILKWLIIIGIGIAILVFIGGQALNYSKSDSN